MPPTDRRKFRAQLTQERNGPKSSGKGSTGGGGKGSLSSPRDTSKKLASKVENDDRQSSIPEPEPEQIVPANEKVEEKVDPVVIKARMEASKSALMEGSISSGFMQQLAWRPRFVPFSTHSVIASHARWPVAILHDDDKISKRWLKQIQELIGSSGHLALNTYCFSDGFGFKDLLEQKCILTLIRCQADGTAQDMKLRYLVSELQEEALRRTAMLGKLRASALGRLAFAVVGLGPREKFCVSKRGDPFCQAAKAVDEAMEDLSGIRLLKSLYIDEATDDIQALLERFTIDAVHAVDAFSQGAWVPEEEKYTGYKWSIDEVQLELHLQSRKGMQDG